MKQSKVIGIILVVLNIALAVVCIILSAGQDKTKPVFDFQAAEVVYRTGMDEEKLKEGITARDNVDGDITDRIVVEKIVTDPAENTAVVFFAVSDRAGNVAKCSKVFPASLEGENEELADQLTQAGYDAAFASESSLTAESTDAAADQENETDNSENAENDTVDITIQLTATDWKVGPADAEIVLSEQDYDLCLPNTAIHQDNQGDFVFAVEEKNTVLGTQNVLVRIPVTVLEVGQSQTSIEGAISPEDSIVVQSTRSPEAGSKVRVKNENA